jgi:hypothetical protein
MALLRTALLEYNFSPFFQLLSLNNVKSYHIRKLSSNQLSLSSNQLLSGNIIYN